MHARFNLTKVPVAWVSSREVHCVAPEHPAGLVSVELTQNDQQYTSGPLHFEYRDMVAHSIHPRSGPVRGGTEVVVRGASFDAPGALGLFCSFAGADVVSASFEGEVGVRCITPPASRAGTSAVQLVDSDAVLVTSVAFIYQPHVVVSSIEPVTGVLAGGTLLRVSGSGFIAAPGLLVRIGGLAPVRARVLSAGLLECSTPAQPTAGLVSVEVSLNERDYSADEVLFEYLSPMRADELSPSRGPSSGGTLVNVSGWGFSQRAALL